MVFCFPQWINEFNTSEVVSQEYMDGFSIRSRVGSSHFILMRVWIWSGLGSVYFTSENSPPLKCEKLCFCCFSWTKPHFLMDIWIWAPPSNQFWKKKPHLCFELLKWIRHIFLSRYREKILLKWSSTCEKMTEIIWFQNILKNSKLSAHILILCMLFRFHLS